MSMNSIELCLNAHITNEHFYKVMGGGFQSSVQNGERPHYFCGLFFSLDTTRFLDRPPFGRFSKRLIVSSSNNLIQVLEWNTLYILALMINDDVDSKAVAIKESGPTLYYLQGKTIFINASVHPVPASLKLGNVDVVTVPALPNEGENVNLEDFIKVKM